MQNIEIRLEQISKKYDSSNNFILDGINLDLFKGDIVGITGKSGGGKSTLLRCIGLLEQPSTGSVYFRNKNVTGSSRKELRDYRRHIGIIFQDCRLLTYKTVWENVVLPFKFSGKMNGKTLSKIDEILKIVNLFDKKTYYPCQLSGGQKQRVAIARALIGDKEILICDEITSALDITHTQEIISLLKHINDSLGVTIVFVSHDLSIIKTLCTRHLLLLDGRLFQANSNVSFDPIPIKKIHNFNSMPYLNKDCSKGEKYHVLPPV